MTSGSAAGLLAACPSCCAQRQNIRTAAARRCSVARANPSSACLASQLRHALSEIASSSEIAPKSLKVHQKAGDVTRIGPNGVLGEVAAEAKMPDIIFHERGERDSQLSQITRAHG